MFAISLAALFTLIVLSPGQASTSQQTDVVRAEVEGRLARHAGAVEAGNVSLALDLYAEDATVRPANMDPVRGKVQLREFFTGWFAAMKITGASYATEEFELAGDKAIHIGTYKGTLLVPGADPVADRGSFTIVWKRQPDGSWRYYRGIFNSSLPVDQTITRKK